MSTRYIAVDSGKADTKVCTRINVDGSTAKRTFPTRVEEKGDRNCLNTLTGVSDTGFIVEYDGRVYGVGDIVSSDDSFTSNQNSKNDNLHKIATLTAIAGSVNNGDEVKVAIGCPIELFNSKANRERYLESILPSGRIDFNINGISKHFTIVKKMVLPESLGIVFTNEKLFADGYVGVIDIGGLNVNATVVLNGKIANDTCFTEKLGRRSIEKEIKMYAEDKYETSFSNMEVDSFIKEGYITDNKDPEAEEESRAFIDQVMTDHVAKIDKVCLKHGWNLRNMHLVFVGGSSIFLKDKIMKAFPKAFIVDNANYANVQGFLRKLCQNERA